MKMRNFLTLLLAINVMIMAVKQDAMATLIVIANAAALLIAVVVGYFIRR